MPRNRPLDDPSVAAMLNARGGSFAQAAQANSLGYQRAKDPSSGQMYDMPLETFDPSRGGYVNPQRPTELLQPASASE